MNQKKIGIGFGTMATATSATSVFTRWISPVGPSRAQRSPNESGASAVVSASATFPLDLVRRRMQMRDATKGDTFLAVFKSVIRKEGFVGLYRGIYPEFAKVVPGVSITYATYELLKRVAGVDTGRM